MKPLRATDTGEIGVLMGRMDLGHRLGRITLASLCAGLLLIYLGQGELPTGNLGVAVAALVTLGLAALGFTYIPRKHLTACRGCKVIAGMLSDVCLLTVLGLLAHQAAGFSYVAMIWLTLRTGLRHGRGYLLLGMALSVAGFSTLLAMGQFLSAYKLISAGLMFGMIAIPLYMWGVCEALMAATDRATDADIAKGRFLAHMSHEFRTPLNGIQGLAELMASCDIPADARGYLTGIQGSAKNLSTTVQELLDFATIEAGRVVVRPDTFSVRSVVDLAMVDVQSLIAKKGLESRICIAENVPEFVYGSGEHARRALAILVCNAVKFTNKGWVEVHVSHQQRGEQKLNLCFRVRDSGRGFNQDVGDRIFQPFEQADESSRNTGGSGLGLAIAKGYIHANNGDIGFRSTPGIGTEFWFTFEVMRIAIAPDVEPPATPLIVADAEDVPRRVLIVDDQDLNRLVLEKMLINAGHEVVSVASGADGIARLTEQWVDVAIVDLHMPVLTGSDLIRWIRDRESARRLPEMPILVLTADGTKEAREDVLSAGATGVFIKPTPMAHVRDYIREATSRSEWSRVPARQELASGCYLTELRQALGQEEVFESVVKHCMTDLASSIEQLRSAMLKEDLPKVAESAHSIKGLAGNLGMELLAKEAEALDEACRSSTVDMDTFEQTMNRIDISSRAGMHVVRGRFMQNSDLTAA